MTNPRESNVWMSTYTGGRFYPETLTENEYRIEDIAHGLALQCRFGGQSREFYSVAQHSVMVSELVPPEHALWGLLHDASEAYLIDLPRPIKRLQQLEGYRSLERAVMTALLSTFGLPDTEPMDVVWADNGALVAEAKMLGLWNPHWVVALLPEASIPSIPYSWSPLEAEARFLRRFRELNTR